MTEAYLATAIGSVKCYDLKEDCVASRGMPRYAIDAGTEVLLSTWDNDRRVAQGWLRGSNGPRTSVWMSLGSLSILGKEVQGPGVQAMPGHAVAPVAPAPLWDRGEPPDTTTDAAPMLPQQMGVVRHAQNTADGVAFYNDLQTALQNVCSISGAIPNNSKVEVINRTHASYAEVRWNGRSVFIRQMHLQGHQVQQAPPAPPAPPLALPAPPAAGRMEARHSDGQASVAWFYTVAAALNDPNNYNGTILNGEQVELINGNADGQHVYATVRWRAQDVVLRTVHLDNLPVQLLNRDGHPQVAFFENVTAGQRNSPAGYIPNGTGATVNNANLDGNYTLALVNLPMGPRTVRTMDVQGLPLRNFQTPAGAAAPAAPVNQAGHYQYQPQPPMPARVTPQPTAPPMPAQVAPQPTAPPMPAQVAPAQQADVSLNSDVFVRHVEGKPLVAFYFDKNEARLLGPEDGSIPSDSIAQLLELDAPNRGAGGHCKIKWKQNGIPLDVYVRRAHLFSAQLVQMARHHMPYPAHARPVRIKHTDSNKPDVVFHYTLEAAQRRDQPHGKIPNDEVALMTEQVPQGKGWVMIWYNYQNVFVRQWHIQQPFKTR